MITFPNAKINLGLNIVERRPDGYHNIETVFYPIPLTDILEIVPATDGATSLTCTGNAVDCPVESNLVMRAYRMLEAQYGLSPVEIHLYKHIPDGAGLGGGSSDAAHAIEQFADVAYGIREKQLEKYTPLQRKVYTENATKMDIKGKYLLLVKPPMGVDTRTAYSRVVPAAPSVKLDKVIAGPVSSWDGLLVNDFEPSVFAALPQLWLIKAQLLDAGAQYAAMSGSGSTVFGIFDNDKLAEAAADTFADFATFVLPL